MPVEPALLDELAVVLELVVELVVELGAGVVAAAEDVVPQKVGE